jgi:diaminohydroxyphosphoribosylaminopyrimidine deaminase/5-amino-6-(5-phosphoribosylamino)uracil reductase
MGDAQYLLVEGGAGAAAAFLAADLVDRLLIYRAPVVLGGRPGVGNLGLSDLAAAHGRWRLAKTRRLGNHTHEVYDRTRCSPE